MPTPIRRIVTGHDQNGRAVILIDGPAPNQKIRAANRVVSTLLWASEETPADASSNRDRADREIGVAPPTGGSVFRIVEFPPANEAGAFDNAAMLAELGLGPDAGDGRHASTHRTRSLDYAIVLEGEIDMAVDEAQVRLRAGDAIVQQATNHAWINNSDKPCRVAFVLLDARQPPQWDKPQR